MLLSSYFVLIIAPRSSRGTKHSQKNSGGAADGRAWPRDAWGQAHGRQPGIPACSWKTKPRQASAHRLFEARDRLCQGKKKKKVSKHKPQALLAGPRAVFPACMPRLVTGKGHAAWRRAGAHRLAELAPRFVLARPPDLLDMSRMVLRTEGPQHLPRGYEIVLYVPVSDADKVGVFHVQSKFSIAASSAPSPTS